MPEPKTLLDFLIAMKQRTVITFKNATGLVNGISAEDGSGLNWIIEIQAISGSKVDLFFTERN